jgi:electron transfer flavoprotein beta subunit
MDVVVCVKYVPEPEGTPTLGPDHLLVREGVNGALDPGDEVGVELALELVEAHGGEVTVVSMGPDDATAAVRRALAMGAHRGVLITDPRLRGADALVTARVLAAAIRARAFDLVVAAVESADGYTGTMPVTMAELLDLPSATIARKVDLDGDVLRVERQTDAGYDVLTCPLPAVVTLTLGANQPRYPSLKGIMQAKQKPVDRPSVEDLGLSAADIAPTQRVTAVEAAAPKPGGEILDGSGGIEKVVDLLAAAKVI